MPVGDYIDDYCTRCKRTTDHAIAAAMGDEVLKTRCRNCDSEHKYRHNRSSRKEMTARQAFDAVLAKVTGEPEAEKPPRGGKS